MHSKNQEVSFEVATKNETAAVAVKPPALADELPPLTTEQRELLKQAHPSLQAQLERIMRRKNQRQPQKQPTTATTPTTTTTPPKWPKHYEDALKNAKTRQEREDILTLIQAQECAKQRNQLDNEIQQAAIQRNHRQPIPQKNRAKAGKKKKRRAPLTILQAIRFKTGARYDLLAAERIVFHICRRQGNKKNQQRKACFESVPNMAKACRIRISRTRKLLAWLTKAGILGRVHLNCHRFDRIYGVSRGFEKKRPQSPKKIQNILPTKHFKTDKAQIKREIALLRIKNDLVFSYATLRRLLCIASKFY